MFKTVIVPVTENITWVGTGLGNGALWSVAANWSLNKVPDSDDNAIFSAAAGVGANTPSTMNLGGEGAFHVGRLIFRDGYSSTLTLNANLFVDVLNMRTTAAVTTGTDKFLGITQRASALPAATIFEASFWTRGTIESSLAIYGENTHPARLEIGDTANPNFAVFLKGSLRIDNVYSTVKWVQGLILVAPSIPVINLGDFHADAPGKEMGGNLVGAERWTFDNQGNLFLGKGKFDKVTLKGAKAFKVATASTGTDLFELAGTVTLDAADALVSVESGTLLITGTLTQSDEEVTVSEGTTLSVSDAYTLSGGTLALDDADVSAGGGLSIGSGGALSGSGTVTADVTNAGTIQVGLNGIFPSEDLAIDGDFTQTGTGQLLMDIESESNDQLDISGHATFDGTFQLSQFFSQPMVTPPASFLFISYASRSGVFSTVNLPSLIFGTLEERYDDPSYPNAFSIWAV